MIGADVEPADIVAHDDQNVTGTARCRWLLRLSEFDRGCRADRRRGRKRSAAKQDVPAIDGAIAQA
jgi:hypothetical protein